MRITKKIFLILFLLFILGSFISYWVEPKFNLWQMDQSIIFKKQDLPLVMMFGPEEKDGKFIVDSRQPQFVIAGPNLTLFYGKYSYNLEIVSTCDSQDLGFMDVVRENGRLGLGAKEIIAGIKGETQIESVEFEAGAGFDYEFRLYSKGTCPFEIRKAWIEREKIDWRTFIQEIWQKIRKVIY